MPQAPTVCHNSNTDIRIRGNTPTSSSRSCPLAAAAAARLLATHQMNGRVKPMHSHAEHLNCWSFPDIATNLSNVERQTAVFLHEPRGLLCDLHWRSGTIHVCCKMQYYASAGRPLGAADPHSPLGTGPWLAGPPDPDGRSWLSCGLA